MPLYVCGPTALAHYRSAMVPAEPSSEMDNQTHLSGAISRIGDIAYTNMTGLGPIEPSAETPLHLLVPSARMRQVNPALVAHLYGRPLPQNSLRQVNSEVCVVSPEFLFVELARELEVPELVALGMELCGTYRRNVDDGISSADGHLRTAFDMPQLTTVDKLRAYIESASAMPGVKRARAALGFVRDCSASPMETIVYLLLCLPRRMGGYALSAPELNPEITFTARGKTFSVRRAARGDLYWRSAHLDLEYNGSDHEQKLSEDAMRRKALERMGIEVIELTYDEVKSAELFHATALRVARALGERARLEGDFAHRRTLLREQLFADEDAFFEIASPEPNAPLYDGTDWEGSFEDYFDMTYDDESTYNDGGSSIWDVLPLPSEEHAGNTESELRLLNNLGEVMYRLGL